MGFYNPLLGAQPPAPKLQKPVETLVSPITGWRLWHMSLDGSKLYSLNSTEVEWEPKKRHVSKCACQGGCTTEIVDGKFQVVSERIHKMDKPVDPRCSCGVWAYKTPDEFLERSAEFSGYAGPQKLVCKNIPYGMPENEESPPTVKVLGEVYLWGRVCVHQYGYRAEFACVKELHRVLKFHELVGIIGAKKLDPQIQEKWRTETWHTSENLSTKLESSLSGLLTSNQEKLRSLQENPSENQNPLAYLSSPMKFSYYFTSGLQNAQQSALAAQQTAASVTSNRSIPQAQAAQVAHKQTVAKSKFWQTISGLRAWQK